MRSTRAFARAFTLPTLSVALLLLSAAAAGAQAPSEVDTLELARLSPEELFLRSSSSALQFEATREPSRVILVRDHERSLPYLVTQLDTDGVRERHALEDILVRIGEPAVAPVIEALAVEAARTDVTRGARMASTVLGRIGDPAAVAPLSRLRGHDDWKVRGAVAGALGRIGTAEAVPALEAMLADGNEIVRKSAAVGLGRVGRRAADEDEPDAGAAAAMTDAVIGTLIDALGDTNYAVRYSASGALAGIGDAAVDRLIEACGDREGAARLMAIRALGGVGSRRALRPLAGLLRDRDWEVRAFTAEALGAIGPDRKARKALEKLVASDPHPLVAAQAAHALDAVAN